MRRLLGIVAALAIASTLAFTTMGGWAVVSVSKVPDAWVTGEPLQLTWQVRQHGLTRLGGLRPTLEARSASRVVIGETWEFAEDGVQGYRGTISFPEPGEWEVTIHSGFGKSRAVLLPWRVVDPQRPVVGTVEDHLGTIGIAAFPEAERGRRLFAALGCVTCHVHRDVPIAGEVNDFGPELTGRRFEREYLARFLADPSIKPPTNGKRMPNLALREKDIKPLIAFINGEQRLTRR